MWGAFETNPPSGPKTAHEKSSLSFILVDIEVRCKILLDRGYRLEYFVKISTKLHCKCEDALFCAFVRRISRTVPSHLFGDAHKSMGKYTELNSVEIRRDFRTGRSADGYFNVTFGSDRCRATGLYKDCAQAVHYDGWSIDNVAGQQRFQLIHIRFEVTALEVYF